MYDNYADVGSETDGLCTLLLFLPVESRVTAAFDVAPAHVGRRSGFTIRLGTRVR